MANEPMDPTDYAAVLSDLQDTSRYGDLVLSLRNEHRLHPLVEWHLGHLLCSRQAGHLHVQAEKYGISNGRIDLVAYEGTRSVIHFELIASNSGHHVFRDTTSLLGSNADAKLAILIDEDLDADVYKTYKRAIPSPAVIEDVPLRMVLLKNQEAAFNDVLQRLLDRAAFRSGSLRSDGFRCELDSYELRPLSEITLRYKNAPGRSYLRVRLRNVDDVVDIIGGNGREIPEGDGQIPVWIPLRKEITRGEYRLEAVLDTGERWAANVTVPSVPPAPSLHLDPSAGHVGATVNFRVADFPPDTELHVTFWQGHSGHGVFNGMLGATGGLTGTFTVPPIVIGFTQTGWHDIKASTSIATGVGSCSV